MKMRKYIGAFMIALTVVTMTACNKKIDVEAVSKTLPGIQVSSLGMFTSGPYVIPAAGTTSTIQLIFGATTTSKSTGAFDVLLTDVTASPNTTFSLHFNSWAGNDVTNTPSAGSISFTTVPTDYPNTTIYQGSIIIKYTNTTPFITGHVYTVKITGFSSDYTPATASTTSSAVTVARLIAIQ